MIMINILAIDDQQYILITIKNTLSGYGINVDTTSNVENAIEIYKEKQHDLILMDNNMPKTSGIEATKLFKEIDPDAKICFLSAYCSTEHVKAALEAGAINYISKPINKTVLVNKIKAILNNKKPTK